MEKLDYYCDAVELVKNSKLSDKDKKETLERMERVVLSPPYKIFSKDNLNYLKSKLEKVERSTVVETLPPDVQTIVHNAERLDAEKHWYKWCLKYARELLKTNREVITCNDPTIKGEKIVQIPLDKEQRVALLKAILFSNSKHKCLMPIIDILEKHVKKENKDAYDKF